MEEIESFMADLNSNTSFKIDHRANVLTDFLWITSLILALYYICKWYGLKKKGYPPSSRLYPWLGNGYVILGCKNEQDIVLTLQRYMKRFGSPATFYLGPFITIVGINRAEHFEAILKSQKAKDKPEFFYGRIGFLKDGLVTLREKKWRVHRKLLQSCYNLKILESFIDTFVRNTIKLCDNLSQHADNKPFHCEQFLSFKGMSALIETLLDTDSEQFDKDELLQIIRDTDEESTTIANRFAHIFSDLVFPITKEGRLSAERIKHWNDFVEKIIDIKFDEWDKAAREGKLKESSSKFMEKAATLGRFHMKMEIMTTCMAGFATTGAAESYTLVMMGIHQDIQEKVQQELQSVFGDSDRPVCLEDLQHLVYLEQVIKETLRLFPPIPHILRELTEDMELDGYELEKGTDILILVDQIHRHPDFWENPNEFNPDNFSRENVAKRHPYAFVPFSAGPRNCLGHRYAYMAMKVAISTVLRQFHVETDMKMSDLKVLRSVTLNVAHLNIRLTKRNQVMQTTLV